MKTYLTHLCLLSINTSGEIPKVISCWNTYMLVIAIASVMCARSHVYLSTGNTDIWSANSTVRRD